MQDTISYTVHSSLLSWQGEQEYKFLNFAHPRSNLPTKKAGVHGSPLQSSHLVRKNPSYNLKVDIQMHCCNIKMLTNLWYDWRLFIQLTLLSGGYSVQKTLQGYAANMGSKISLLWMGRIFTIFPNLSQNFGKIRWFCSKFLTKIG